MAPNAPIEVPDWRVIHQGLTAKHRCWEPSLGFWGLNIHPFCSSAGGVADFLLLYSSLSLLFASWTWSSSLHHVLAFLLFPPLLGSACSTLEGRVGWRAQGGDFGGGGGSLGWADFPGLPFLGWFSINSSRLFCGFLWMPISSGRLLRDDGWLNTLNSSTDSVRSTKSYSSYSSFPSSSSWRMGEGNDTPAKRVAIGSDWVNGVFLGSGIPSGTTNPS